VLRVDADRARKAAAVPNDPGYAGQWALPKIGWDVARDTVTPAGSATIAVLDTGVSVASAELAGRSVAGFSAFGTDPTVDPNGHGTWLASIAAAETNNAAGIAGVAYAGARVMPVQVLGADGTGQDSDVIAGVVAAADAGAGVILMGFSNPGFSQSLQDAIDYAWSRGAVLVAATGNAGSTEPTYPAGDAKVVGVSATDQADALWASSNSGTAAFMAAPGVGIVADAVGGGTTSVTGTSSSAAIVAGAAALLRAKDPAASPGTIVGRLARNADPAGTVAQTGNGRVNVARAVADTATTEVVPAGAAPLGAGGPFVGPYVAAALGAALQGQNNPACSSGGICPWQTTNLSGWAEQQDVPLRLFINANQNGKSETFNIAIDHAAGGSQGLDKLFNWSPSTNVSMSNTNPTPVKTSTGGGAETYTYTFTATMNNALAGDIQFKTRLSALGQTPSPGPLSR
jgi:subtilisin family serine protease